MQSGDHETHEESERQREELESIPDSDEDCEIQPAWSAGTGRLKPSRGLILDWKREGRRWEALVVWHDDAALKPVGKMDWLRIQQLIPVPVDPNWTGPGS